MSLQTGSGITNQDVKIKLLHLEKYNQNGSNHDQRHRYDCGYIILTSKK